MIIIDAEGAERDWAWVKEKYNLPDIDRAPKDENRWEVVELRERIGPVAMRISVASKPCVGIPIMIGWPDGHVVQGTNIEGYTDFILDAYYRPPKHGPYWVHLYSVEPSDRITGLGMIGKTNHAHLEPTFRFVKGEEEPSPPLPDCEEYRIAIDKIREIVKAFPPLVD